MKKILVTGAAGFIGFHLTNKLLHENIVVYGIDNLNNYYDVKLKEDRLAILKQNNNFCFEKMALEDRSGIEQLFHREKFDVVINLAAQAGVRYSLVNPYAYAESNLMGFLNILEGCKNNNVEHLLFASSSSVYGSNTKMPFSVHQNVDHPISLYAATKKSNELMAHSYASLYNLPCTGLRFFTVYGPWGRPDMALFLFTKAILDNKAINLFNFGNMQRDFTYVDDIVESLVRLIQKKPKHSKEYDTNDPDPSSSTSPYKIYNIGNSSPVPLSRLVEVLEKCLRIKSQRNLLPIQQGDVEKTYADVSDLANEINFQPSTPIEVGISKFVEWYKRYYCIAA